MTHALIVYGTTEGHTRIIADHLGDALRAEGAIVGTYDVEDIPASIVPEVYDQVIVAASVHVGEYKPALVAWVRAHRDALATRPTAFVSVCLGILDKRAEIRAEESRIVERFLKETGWTPTTTHIVAGALMYSKYPWLKRQALRYIAWRSGGHTDTSRDWIYTDWDDLQAFARGLLHPQEHVPA